MSHAPSAPRATCRAGTFTAAVIVAVALVIAIPVTDPVSVPTRAATAGPIAAIVVGPAAGDTVAHIQEARAIAAQLRSYGAVVREVHSPNATWTAVTAAASGAHLFVYLGRGRGHPGPYGAFDVRTMDGLGLNRAAARGHSNPRFYGEYYIRRSLGLASGAIVLLNGVPYAAGSSEPGRQLPTRETAVKRADNYAAGFLAAGAAAVYAGDRSVTTVVRDLFGASRSMRSVFWRSPWTSTRDATTFVSRRTPRSSGIVAPYAPGRYLQSVAGRLQSTTTDWRNTWDSAVRVASIPALLAALDDDAVAEIIVENGTYRVSPASAKKADSLWIGARYADRSNPVTVRAETDGGVTFDGGGARYFGGISFGEGAHHQTWQGFRFANGTPTQTGVITFGWSGDVSAGAAPHHITLRNVELLPSLTSTSTGSADHGVYFSQALGGARDILIDGLRVDGSGGLDTALTFYHSAPGEPNAWNVTVRRLNVTGTRQAIEIWDETVRNLVIEDSSISGALSYAVRYEHGEVTLRRVTSANSGQAGFYSSQGASPPGVTFIDCTLR